MSTPPDPFAPTPLFATPLFSCLLSDFDQHRPALIREILSAQSSHPGNKRSNRNAWHSIDNFAEGSAEIGWVLSRVLTYAKRALAPYYKDWATQDLRLANYWANVLGAGGFNAPHHHVPTHWSGVTYVQTGKVGTSAEDQSGMIEFLNPVPAQALYGRSGNFAYTPKEGQALLFPATLVHFVHPHSGDEPRISIAYNFTVVPKAR